MSAITVQNSNSYLKFAELPVDNNLALSSRITLKSDRNILFRDVKVSIWSSNIISLPVVNLIYFIYRHTMCQKWEKHTIDNKIVFINKKSLRTSQSLSLVEQTLGDESSNFDITKNTIKSLFKKQSAIFLETKKTSLLLQKSTNGRIQVLKKMSQLGKGGYKTVSLVQDIASKREFALSKIRAVEDLDHLKRIVALTYKEVKIAQELKQLTGDPGIIKIHRIVKKNDPDKAHGTVLILSEACKGGVLSYNNLKDKPLTERLSLFLSLTKVIHNIHKAGHVHRDLKPDNIMLTKDQEIRVIDFGSACKLRDLVRRSGTPKYMPPEVLQIKNKKNLATTQHDIWSLGVILNELVTGKNLCDMAVSELNINMALIKDKRLRIECEKDIASKIVQMVESKKFGNKLLPNELQNVLDKMLKVDPEKRISLGEVIPILKKTLEIMKLSIEEAI